MLELAKKRVVLRCPTGRMVQVYHRKNTANQMFNLIFDINRTSLFKKLFITPRFAWLVSNWSLQSSGQIL